MKTTAMKMTKPALAIAIASIVSAQGVSAADADTEQRLESLEERLQYTEQRLKAQDDTILAQQEGNSLSIGGVIEVEATSSEGEQDLSIATVELGIGADITDGVSGEIVLLYEGDTLDVDTATITVAPEGSAASFTVGQFVVPFGTYDTNLLSDPLTLDMGETGDSGVIQADFEAGAATISAYAFNGQDDGDINDFGINLGFALEDAGLGVNLGMINNFQGEEVNAIALSAMYENGPFTVIAEHVRASDAMADGTEPSATNLELGYGTLLGGKPSTFAIAYQTTDDAQNLENDDAEPLVAEKRLAAALTIGIMENTGLGFEIAKDTDYADESSNTFTAKLSVEF